MADENKARVAELMQEMASTPAETAEVVEIPAEQATVEPAAPAQDGEQPPDEGSPDDGRKSVAEPTELEKAQHAFQRKVNKLTRRVGERDMRLAELEEKLQRYEQPQVPQKPVALPSDPEKGLEDFDFDPVAYQRYLARVEAEKLLTERESQKESERIFKAFKEKEAAFAADHPDYDTLTKDPTLPFTQSMVQVIYETENPPAVAYYLAQNRDQAAAIAAMPAVQAARAIGRIEALVNAPLAAPPSRPSSVTNAPLVASGVTARAPVTKSVSDMSVEDHLERIKVKSKR